MARPIQSVLNISLSSFQHHNYRNNQRSQSPCNDNKNGSYSTFLQLNDDPSVVQLNLNYLGKLCNVDSIGQFDGALSVSNISLSSDSDCQSGITHDEIPSVPSPAVFGISSSGSFELVDSSDTPDLPLIIGANFRSVGNKQHSVYKLLSELVPDMLMGVEIWEREAMLLSSVINTPGYSYISSHRQMVGRKNIGGGTTVIFN